jgi:hypothetical protein
MAAIVAVAASAVPAHADVTKDQCIDSNTQAQALRRDGKLTAARTQLLKCGDPKCPAIIRDDCTQRLDELEHAQPTIVFDAKDGDGHDLVAVQVTVDGQPFADKLEGKALRVDPGAHTFVFTATGQAPVTQSFVIREGEAERHERIVIGAPAARSTTAGAAASSAAPLLPATPSEPPPSSGLGTQRLLGIGVAGVGVVGIGVGAVFGLLASSAWNNAKNACGGDTSHCTDVSSANSYKSTTNTDGTISTIAFVAGGVLVAGGALLFFTGGGHESEHAASLWVAPTVAPGQGGAVVRGTF